MKGFKIPSLCLTTILVLMTFSNVIKEIQASGEFLVILIIAFLFFCDSSFAYNWPSKLR